MYSNRQIWDISLPIFLSLLAQNVINITDTAFLGRVGEVELGASAMGGLYYICIFTVAFGFSAGSQIIIGRRNGERRYDAVGPVVIQGALFLLVLAAVSFVGSRLWAERLMHVMVSSDELRAATMEYLDWRVYGFFFAFVSVMFRALFVGITRTRVLTFASVVMSVVNVVLDYLLIFGHAGLPRLGLAGAAIASVSAEAASVVFLAVYTRLTVDRRRYGLDRFRRFDLRLIRQVLNISGFTMLQYFISMSTYFIFFIAVERLGQRDLAVANIARSLYIALFIPVNALSTATNTMVSNLLGAGNASEVIPLIRRLTFISVGITAVFAALLLLFPRFFLSVYTNDAPLIASAVPSVVVIALAAVCSAASCIVFSAISGTGNTRPAFLLEMLALVAYTLYIYIAVIHLRLPVHLSFISDVVYYVAIMFGGILYFRLAAWHQKTV